ncbi:hypothetical protein [Nonomuraea glycinis]|jgi:hypothetical protein|uniref:hypothetical protein n=1 Tax=Nonomuraea glycinis TaxID=2047744 RepID=UPI002E1417A9|nr:hypothetical protein OHA68_11790 [Nonomuraea glycinis]
MMRRILVGAAMVGALFGFSATAASADVGPSTANTGSAVLGQWAVVDDATLANDVLNDSLKYVNVLSAVNLQNVDVDLLNNQTKTHEHHH